MKRILIGSVFIICIISILLLSFDYEVINYIKEDDNTLNKYCIGISNTLIECEDNVIYEFNLEPNLVGKLVEIEYKNTFELSNVVNIKENDDYLNMFKSDDLFSAYYEQALTMLNKMSLEEKIGQLLLVRVPASNQIADLTKYHFGGYLLFRRDIKNKTKQELINNIANYQKNSQIPLLIAIDEEGGGVSRLNINSKIVDKAYKSPRDLYAEGGFDLIKKDNTKKNNLLMSLGINLNLAPVLDISTNPKDYMYKRSLGQDELVTGEFAKAIIETSQGTSISNTLKHFPGYGSNLDTHQGLSYDNRSLDSIINVDLLPFKVGIEAGAESVMVNHNIIVNLDDQLPASLSYKVHNLLRGNLSFTGIIITDDLSMGAINNNYKNDAIINAINYGNDIIIVSDYKKTINDIKSALENKLITENIINKRVLRILAWKYYKGLIVP